MVPGGLADVGEGVARVATPGAVQAARVSAMARAVTNGRSRAARAGIAALCLFEAWWRGPVDADLRQRRWMGACDRPHAG